MDSGSIFTYKGERFLARSTGSEFLASKLVINDKGEERPTVGKPRFFKAETGTEVVGKFNIPTKTKPFSAENVRPKADDEAHADEQWQRLEENRSSIARCIEFTGDGDEDWGSTKQG
jgi:hypothetical protein